MEVYFTSPTLGQIFGTVTTNDRKNYFFTGKNALINVELCRSENGKWFCQKDQWLLDEQIKEIGLQIDKAESWLSAQ